MRLVTPARTIALGLVAVTATSMTVVVQAATSPTRTVAASTACPPGQHAEADAHGRCSLDGVESYDELAKSQGELDARRTAPYGSVRSGAYTSALSARDRMPRVDGATPWTPVGSTPLDSFVDGYARVNGLGLRKLSGRIEDLAYDSRDRSFYVAAVSNGGVWATNDAAKSWHSIGDPLPTQVVGAVAITHDDKGRRVIVIGTGDPAFGGNSLAGLGAFSSRDGGRTWQQSKGVPGGLTFALKVDPTNPSVLYAATSKGLYRSDDTGRSFRNVGLPTKCTNIADPNCFFANMVTDVVVRAADANGKGGGQVLAAVGWRASQKPNYAGKPQSPQNGIYTSPTGRPGTFSYVDPAQSGFLSTALTGRTALSVANGPGQNHNWVAALVQDAGKFNNSETEFDLPDAGGKVPNGSVLNGVYISTDFGKTWTKTADASQLALPTTGTALIGANSASYRPGVQSWYNEWVEFDPTRTDTSGAPTRLVLGLEEVWENDTPLDPTFTSFKVIGRYFAGGSCAGLNLGLPVCPTNRPMTASTTTHPDQHAGMLVPDRSGGGVTLVVGNDGGAYTQHAGPSADFSNDQWGDGANNGLHTLQPYGVAVAKDGTMYAGLQDNGEMKITPQGQQIAVFGGDGFFSAVDPENSDIAYEEYTGGQMSVTSDGGKSWTSIDPGLTSPLFSTPFAMDRVDPGHLITAGRDVQERTGGPSGSWTTVYDLGTRTHPGDASASSAAGDPDNQESAIDLYGPYAYAGFCGYCDLVTQGSPFHSGIATNVGGNKPAKIGTSDGWHIAKAAGLPNRYITSIRMDPANPAVVYVTLGGYGRRWAPPGALGDDTAQVGTGHVFRSVDGGEHFTDISGNLPDAPANWSVVRDGHLVVATDVGVFESSNTRGGTYGLLGNGLPTAPVFQLVVDPADTSHLVAATFGRGIYSFEYPGGPTRPNVAGATTSKLASWSGQIPPGAAPTSECTQASPQDAHTVTYKAPSGNSRTSLTFTITWTPASPEGEDTSDEVLTVLDGKGNAVGSSDGSSTSESVTLANPPSGTYTAVACGFANVLPQDYAGTATVTVAPGMTAPAPRF